MENMTTMLARIQAAGRTDIGRKRDKNQDHYLIADLSKSMQVTSSSLNLEPGSRLYGVPQGRLFVVADGMGGHQGGNRASTLAIDFLINRLLNNLHWFYRIDQDNEDDFVESLKSLLRSAHETIEKESNRSSEFRGMGTTFTLAYVAWPRLYVLHVGDTRCYLLRRGQMVQLTRDHTMASQLAEKGNLSRKELGQSPWANVLWNALGGGGRDVVADVTKMMLEPDDVLMLCSDGLNKHVEDDEIQNILEIESEATGACRSLIDLANYRGGTDNITAIVAKFATPETGPAKTLVSAQVTLERMLGDLAGYTPQDTEPAMVAENSVPVEVDPSDRDTDPSLIHPKDIPTADSANHHGKPHSEKANMPWVPETQEYPQKK